LSYEINAKNLTLLWPEKSSASFTGRSLHQLLHQLC
jgi:hypothetical protein